MCCSYTPTSIGLLGLRLSLLLVASHICHGISREIRLFLRFFAHGYLSWFSSDDIWGILKWWYPTTMGFPTKNNNFGVFWGYYHLKKPHMMTWVQPPHMQYDAIFTDLNRPFFVIDCLLTDLSNPRCAEGGLE